MMRCLCLSLLAAFLIIGAQANAQEQKSIQEPDTAKRLELARQISRVIVQHAMAKRDAAIDRALEESVEYLRKRCPRVFPSHQRRVYEVLDHWIARILDWVVDQYAIPLANSATAAELHEIIGRLSRSLDDDDYIAAFDNVFEAERLEKAFPAELATIQERAKKQAWMIFYERTAGDLADIDPCFVLRGKRQG